MALLVRIISYAVLLYTHIRYCKKCSLLRYHVIVRLGGSGITAEGDEIEVGIKSEPERGKANRELVKKLAEHFGVPVQNVRIVSGHTSRKKIVDVL